MGDTFLAPIDGYERLTGQRDELEPDPCLPAQFFHPASLDTPERRLFAAVLHCALEDAEHGCRTMGAHAQQGRHRRGFIKPSTEPTTYWNQSARAKQERRKRMARDWILSNERTDPMDFVSVCEVLGLEPDAVRTAVRTRWQ